MLTDDPSASLVIKPLYKWQFRLTAWRYALTDEFFRFFFFFFMPSHEGTPTYVFSPTNKNSRVVPLWWIFSLTWQKRSVVPRRRKYESGRKGHPTKGRIEFREKSTIRLAKTRNVISLHASTRPSVIDGFESPSKVAPLFRGTYLLVLVTSRSLCATALLPSQHICPLHEWIRRKMLYSLPSYLVIVWRDSDCTFLFWLSLVCADHVYLHGFFKNI